MEYFLLHFVGGLPSFLLLGMHFFHGVLLIDEGTTVKIGKGIALQN